MNNQTQNNGFTEVGGISRGLPFDPRATEKNQMRYVEGDPANVLDGYLVLMKQVPSKKEPGKLTTIWKIQTVNPDSSLGDIYDVIGDTVLNDRLAQMPLQTFIRVAYTGRKHKANMSGYLTQTNSYHTWFVGKNDNVMPLAQVKTQYGEKFSPAYMAAMAGGQTGQNQGQPQFSQQNAPQYGNQSGYTQGQQQYAQGQPQQQQQFGQPQAQPPQQQQWNQQQAPQQGQQQFQQAPQQGQFGTSTQQFGNQNFQQAPQQAPQQGQQFNPAGAQQAAPAPQQGQNFQQAPPAQGTPAPGQPFKTDLPF